MQLTNHQKIYAAVLGLAVVAFGFDRFVIGPGGAGDESAAVSSRSPASPSRARARTPAARAANRPDAGAPATAQASSAGAVVVPGGASAPPVPLNTLAQRLQAVARPEGGPALDLENVKDAFRPSAAWIAPAPPPPPKPVAVVAAPRDEAKEFREKYKNKLTTVIKQATGGIAVIDAVAVSVGQSIDGFRLVAVKDRSAVLWRGDQRVELRIGNLPETGGPGSGTGSGTSEKMAGTHGGR